ncbi:MAG TPA: apolipoprotein N-acyltransferase [Candidatus Binatia bacterium]|nr:apolipoprotein N-acyltransferase [Candidatus Binatia bacterium]
MAKHVLLGLLAAVLLAAPYIKPVLFPLAWIAFIPFFWSIERAEKPRQAILSGWSVGFFAHLAGFHWLIDTISVFGGFPYAASIAVFLVYAALQGLQMALFAAFVRTAGFGPLQLFPALLWVPLEFLFPLLFPWYLANSQGAFSWFIQTADLVGPYGASFVVMWFNAALYKAVFASEQERRGFFLPVAYASLALIVSIVYGYQRLERVAEEMAGARKISVGSVQANVGVDLKWDPGLAKQNLQKHVSLTSQLDEVPIVIWPESAIEFWIPENIQVLPLELLPPLKSARANFIFGARSFRGKPGTANFRAFNTAFVTDDKGRVLGRYHKQVLLAFGEYLPFAKLLSHLPALPFADGFTAGEGPRVFHLPRGVRAAPLICYEDLMPDLVRKFVSETGANVLVNLTNDAWYGQSVGPWQHLWLAQFRAIETRRSLLRVTNTGVTSLVNAKGEVAQVLPTFEPAVMHSEVDLLTSQTYYVRFGDWFAWAITILAAATLLLKLKRGLSA